MTILNKMTIEILAIDISLLTPPASNLKPFTFFLLPFTFLNTLLPNHRRVYLPRL